MGSENTKVRIAEIAEIVMGQSPRGETYNKLGMGVPLLNGPTEFGMTYPKPALWTTDPTKLCKKGDILFCVRGSTTGRMNWADREYCIGRGIAAFRAKNGPSDTRLLHYALVQNLNRLLALSTGSVFPNLSLTDFESFEIPWPEERVRLSITKILGTLDDKIELNRKMNETLEAMAKAIFKSWFVDFDPVRAKMEGSQPVGMDKETADLFPSSFEDSHLGEIPNGWKAGCLGDVAENIRTGVSPDDVLPETSYIGLDHMPRRSISLGQWGSAEGISSNKFRFRQGDILFGKLRPYFHKVGVAITDGVCSTDILVIVPKSSEWYGLVLFIVSSDDFVNYTDAVSTGTKMPRTNWNDMARYELAIPTVDIGRIFSEKMYPLVQALRSNILQSRTLASMRDSLLPKLISGQIRIRDAEDLVGKVIQ